MTVNQLAVYSGVSAASISRYETGERGTPKPPTIEKLAKGLRMDYEELMRIAGYVESEHKKESGFTLPESVYESVIREAEVKYGVNLRDDPAVNAILRELILNLAKMKKEN